MIRIFFYFVPVFIEWFHHWILYKMKIGNRAKFLEIIGLLFSILIVSEMFCLILPSCGDVTRLFLKNGWKKRKKNLKSMVLKWREEVIYALRGGRTMKSSKETQISFLSVKDSTIFLSQINSYHFPFYHCFFLYITFLKSDHFLKSEFWL